MTSARAARASAFKKCCLKTGRFDGSNRDNYFPRIGFNGVLDHGHPVSIRWCLTNRSSCQAARRAAGRERLRNAAFGGTLLALFGTICVWRVTVAGGPQLSSIR